ncbi:MAG: MFS transporter, partial [Dehalococcoidia bacterium]|nr:MFS transporter [Dehalococcoidia bacterium]
MTAHTDGVRPPAGFGPVLRYGWVILIVSFVIHLLVGVERPIFGGFFSTWKESFGWSAAAISLAASINVAVRGVAGPFTGNLVDRLGPRRVVAMYTIILAVSLFGMSRMNQLWQLYLFYGVMAGLASSLSVAVPPLIVRWFRRGTTLALSVPTTGMLVGQAGLVPLLTLAYLAGGWRLPWILLGLADVALLLIVVFGIRDNPSVSEGRQAGEAASVWSQSRGVGLGRACGTGPFWLMATAFFSCG